MAQSLLSNEAENDAVAIDGRRMRLPQWVVLLLFTLISAAMGGAYFMGQLASDVKHGQQLRVDDIQRAAEQRRELSDQVEIYRLKNDGLAKEVAELRGRIESRRRGD